MSSRTSICHRGRSNFQSRRISKSVAAVQREQSPSNPHFRLLNKIRFDPILNPGPIAILFLQLGPGQLLRRRESVRHRRHWCEIRACRASFFTGLRGDILFEGRPKVGGAVEEIIPLATTREQTFRIIRARSRKKTHRNRAIAAS